MDANQQLIFDYLTSGQKLPSRNKNKDLYHNRHIAEAFSMIRRLRLIRDQIRSNKYHVDVDPQIQVCLILSLITANERFPHGDRLRYYFSKEEWRIYKDWLFEGVDN